MSTITSTAPSVDANSPLATQLIQKLTSALESIDLSNSDAEANMFGGHPEDGKDVDKHASFTINHIPITVDGFEPTHASISFEYKFFANDGSDSLFDPVLKDDDGNAIKTSFEVVAGAYSENWMWLVNGDMLNSQAVGISEGDDTRLAKTVLDAVYDQLGTPYKLCIAQWILKNA